jgi:hypothetical protein
MKRMKRRDATTRACQKTAGSDRGAEINRRCGGRSRRSFVLRSRSETSESPGREIQARGFVDHLPIARTYLIRFLAMVLSCMLLVPS